MYKSFMYNSFSVEVGKESTRVGRGTAQVFLQLSSFCSSQSECFLIFLNVMSISLRKDDCYVYYHILRVIYLRYVRPLTFSNHYDYIALNDKPQRRFPYSAQPWLFLRSGLPDICVNRLEVSCVPGLIRFPHIKKMFLLKTTFPTNFQFQETPCQLQVQFQNAQQKSLKMITNTSLQVGFKRPGSPDRIPVDQNCGCRRYGKQTCIIEQYQSVGRPIYSLGVLLFGVRVFPHKGLVTLHGVTGVKKKFGVGGGSVFTNCVVAVQ